jgi:SAM-dependent methyltransferase
MLELTRRMFAFTLGHAALAATPGHAGPSEAEAKMFSTGSAYEQYMGRWSRVLAPAYIAFAGLSDHQQVLDVGTGTGAVASTLATMTASSEIVGVDPSAAFIRYASQNARSSRVRFEAGDAQSLQYGDAAFDHTMALLVMNFIPDHDKAIGEMRRVTRPGGVVSACVWDYDAGMESLRFFWDEAVALEPAAAARDERNMKLSREGQLGALWRKAGLTDVREKALVIDQAFSSFGDYWAPFLTGTGPGGAYVASLDADGRARLEARLRKRLLGNRVDGAFTLKARAWCVRGEVPAAR